MLPSCATASVTGACMLAGIMLTPQQWHAAMESAGSVAEAAQSKSAGLRVDLGNNRQLLLREVGKTLCVDVREYYDKGSELAPGKKGAACALPFATYYLPIPCPCTLQCMYVSAATCKRVHAAALTGPAPEQTKVGPCGRH